MLFYRLVLSTLALVFLAWVPTTASAQTKMVMSGKHKMYCCDNPPVPAFNQPATGAPKGYGAGLGKVYNSVTATGVSNQTLLIPTGRIGLNANNTMATPMTPKFISLSTKVNWYNGGVALAPGGSWPTGTAFTGGSTWSFCPIAKGPGVGSCTAPSLATGLNRNGRIVRKAGPNKFGGTMNLIGRAKSKGKRFLISPLNPLYVALYPDLADTVIGGAPASGTVAVQKNYVNKIGSPTSAKVLNPAYLSFRGAGPWGTGAVTIEITMNAFAPLVTVGVTGYDARNASGVGSLQLVSGVIYNGINVTGTVGLANAFTVSLPEPEPAVGVAAAALGLALIGFLRRRR